MYHTGKAVKNAALQAKHEAISSVPVGRRQSVSLASHDDRNEERISLTPKAFGVLRYLVEHSGRLVTQNELLEALWPDTFVQPEVIKSHILDIRTRWGTVRRTLNSSKLCPGVDTGLSLRSATFQPNQ
jgi:DNA-binding response OmpR family regulator